MSTPTVVLLVVVLGGVALVGVSALRHRVLAAISARNVRRRRAGTLLVVLGSMVGTAMIAGGLILGDAFERGAHHLAFQRVGEVDQVVSFTGHDQRPAYVPRQALLERADVDALNAITRQQADADLVDGALAVIQEPAPVQALDAEGDPLLMRPQVLVLALDLEAVTGFGERPVSLPDLAPGEALLSRSLARELELRAGDAVRVQGGDRALDLTVRAVVEDDGLTGYRGERPDDPRVRGPLLLRLDDGQRAFASGRDEVNALLVSHRGGVLEGADDTAAVRPALGAGLDGMVEDARLTAAPLKRWAIEGVAFMGIMFVIFSSFVIAAGVLLVVTIYTMLAEERRTEMGTMRALGAPRGHLVRLFAYEGLLYSLAASVVGVAVGVGLAAAMIRGLDRGARGSWFLPEEVGLTLVVRPGTLAVAASIGLLIAMGTVVVVSLRASRVDVVAALRDLPTPPSRSRRPARLVHGVVVLLGLLLTGVGLRSADGYLVVIGPVVLALGTGLLVRRRLGSRRAFTPVLLGVAVYSQLALQLPSVSATLHDDGPMIFFLTGLVLVFAGIGLLALNLPVVTWLVRAVQTGAGRLLPVLRIGVAHPASRPGRTGLTLGMFALIIYVVTLIATMEATPRHHVEQLSGGMLGGFDAVLTTGPQALLGDASLRATAAVRDGRIRTTSAVRGAEVELPAFRHGDVAGHRDDGLRDPDAPFTSVATGLDDAFLHTGRTRLAVRDAAYATDAEAWAALADDEELVILEFHYSGTTWEPHPELGAGDTVELHNPATGELHSRRVIGRTADDPVEGPLAGILMSRSSLERIVGVDANRPQAHLLAFAESDGHRPLANEVERELIDHGAQVELVAESLERNVGTMVTLFRILQGYLAFGLVVGVAGLGVVAARAVHQRRREVGTLRALGYQRGMVLACFLAEGSVVAILGVTLGIVAGSVSGYLLAQEMWRDADLAFVWPAGQLALLAGAVYAASLLFTYLPARRAARLAPVEALRPRE